MQTIFKTEYYENTIIEISMQIIQYKIKIKMKI